MKYGFVYIWFDRKHKRYYIGCRWGHIDDGYVCSSTWMKNAYNRRPDDFKRRILTTNISSKLQTLEEEYRWLSKIRKQELGQRYYNLYNHHFGHWSTDQYKRNFILSKNSQRHKGKSFSPATQFKKGDRPSPQTEFKKGSIPVNKGKTLEELYGVEKAGQLRQQNSLQKQGKRLSPRTEFKKGQTTGSLNINACKIQTPYGVFDTIAQAVKITGMSAPAIRSRLNKIENTEWIRL